MSGQDHDGGPPRTWTRWRVAAVVLMIRSLPQLQGASDPIDWLVPSDEAEEAAVTELTQVAGHTRQRIPLRTYLDYRLGRNQRWWRQIYNVVVRPLAAPSFAEFWRTWNPVWGYYLSVWYYRPARRVLPHAAAVMIPSPPAGSSTTSLPHS